MDVYDFHDDPEGDEKSGGRAVAFYVALLIFAACLAVIAGYALRFFDVAG